VDGIKEMLDRLSDLNEGELSDLESKIISEFETVEKQDPTAQVVDSMTALADALDAVRGEQQNRVAAQKDLETRAAEAASRVKPRQEEEDPAAEGDTPPADDTAPVDAPVPEDPATVPAEDPTDVPPEQAEAPSEETEETEEEKKRKKQAVPGTFEAKDSDTNPANPNPDPTIPPADPAPGTTPDNEPTAPDNTPAPPSNESPASDTSSDTPENTPTSEAEQPAANITSLPAETSTSPSAQQEEIPVAASASNVVVTPPAENRPVPRQSASVAITAGADIPGYSAGTELSSVDQVTDAFMKRLQNLQRVSSPNGQQYTVATLTASFPEDRVLEQGDVDGNWQKIQDVTGVPAMVAAAGACIPLEIRYDIDGLGSTDTPVQDSLPRFTADRGGIRFYPGPLLPSAGYSAGMGIWDPLGNPASNVELLGNQGAAGAIPTQATKPCYPVQCLPFVDAVLEAVTMCLCFDNLTGRVFPELIRAHNELALVQHARLTEQYMLEKIKDQATHFVNATGSLAAPADLLTQVDRVAMSLRYRNRISPTQSFRAIFPYWVKDMIRADLSMRMPGDGGSNFAAADNTIDQWFRARGINATWSLESSMSNPEVPDIFAGIAPTDPDTTGPLGMSVTATLANNCDGYPDTVEWDMFAEGTWLVLDGGTLDLGVIRDSTHVANNTYCEFTESFYNVARVGGESVHVTSTLDVTGAAAALADACA
jgi:hypothetical protein